METNQDKLFNIQYSMKNLIRLIKILTDSCNGLNEWSRLNIIAIEEITEYLEIQVENLSEVRNNMD